MNLPHDWANLSPEEYLEMRLKEIGVSEKEIEDFIKEIKLPFSIEIDS